MPTTELMQFYDVIKKLRDPQTGCPWDLEQTHESLLKYLFEEAYEFKEAVEKKDPVLMKEELGDILLQVFLHSVIAEQSKLFSLSEVAQLITEKMVRRHPHVFQDNRTSKLTTQEVLQQWDDLKQSEQKRTNSLLSHKLLYASGLEGSYQIGLKSQKIKFDWENYHQVLAKVKEELNELEAELVQLEQHNASTQITNSSLHRRIEEEMGDLFFSLAQLARHLHISPEDCAVKANKKFIKRFQMMEQILKNECKNWDHLSMQDKESYWIKAKNEKS
jgi:MazG family protein